MDRETLPFDGLEGMDDIPDPAAYLAARPAPEPKLPAELSPTRPARARLGRLALGGAVLWVVLIVSIAGLRSDLLRAGVATPLVLWTLLAGFGLLLTLMPRARGLPAGVRTVQVITLSVPLGFLVAVAGTTSLAEPSPEGGAAVCMATASSIALAPLGLAALTLRRSFLSAPVWRGAAIGALCGLAGTLGVHAHCPVGALFHVVLAHGMPIALGALLGAAAGALNGRA